LAGVATLGSLRPDAEAHGKRASALLSLLRKPRESGMDRQQLRETLLDVLEQETWERPANLADHVRIRDGLKLDSVDLLSVTLRVENQLGISLDSRDFEKIVTVGDLLNTIEARLAATPKRKAA
jgi:acyl carrier protein